MNIDEDRRVEAKKIANEMIRLLGLRGWERHLMETIDYFYPRTPKECRNLKELKLYRRKREKFIIEAKNIFGIDEQRRV